MKHTLKKKPKNPPEPGKGRDVGKQGARPKLRISVASAYEKFLRLRSRKLEEKKKANNPVADPHSMYSGSQSTVTTKKGAALFTMFFRATK